MTLKSATTTVDRLPPVHPGEILTEEFMNPLSLSSRALAERLGVPANRVSEIVAGRRSISGDTALRLSAAFGTTPEFWMNLQSAWSLETARDGFDAVIERVA